MASVAAKDLAEIAAEDAAKAAAEDASKAAAEDASKVAAEDASKVAAEDAAKVAAENAAKGAAENAAKDSAKSAAEDAAKNSSKYTAADAAKAAAAASALGLGAYTYLNAKDAADKSNSTPRTITKVEAGTGTALKITFTPAIRIVMNDQLTISGTKTTPSFDGSYTPVTVITDGQITIDPGKSTSQLAPGGTINVKTSVSNQGADSIGQAATTLGTTAGDVGSGLFSGLFNSLGLGQYATYIEWGCGILCCLIICSIIAYFVMTMKKD